MLLYPKERRLKRILNYKALSVELNESALLKSEAEGVALPTAVSVAFR